MSGPRDGASEAGGDYHGSAALRKAGPHRPDTGSASYGLFRRAEKA
ncbi:MAG TPA: hypothetical protein VGF77_14475 [Allosphingosinicella sp.]|jgi:hypothetical protein